MKRMMLAAVMLAAMEGGARADSLSLALSVGDLIGSEEACGLAFDQGRIEDFIARNVAADDMDFLGVMNTAVNVMPREIAKMTQSQRTAHCAQMRRVATAYKFVK